MRNIIFLGLVVILLSSCGTSKQNQSPKANAGTYFSDTVINKILSETSVLLVAQSISPQNSYNKSYLMIALQKNKWFKIDYHDEGFRSATYTSYALNKYEISKHLGDSILKIFLKNKFFSIKEVDEGCNPDMTIEESKKINCGVSDGQTLALSLYIKGQSVTKTYTAPEDWLCCSRKEDRQIFIKCLNAVRAVK